MNANTTANNTTAKETAKTTNVMNKEEKQLETCKEFYNVFTAGVTDKEKLLHVVAPEYKTTGNVFLFEYDTIPNPPKTIAPHVRVQVQVKKSGNVVVYVGDRVECGLWDTNVMKAHNTTLSWVQDEVKRGKGEKERGYTFSVKEYDIIKTLCEYMKSLFLADTPKTLDIDKLTGYAKQEKPVENVEKPKKTPKKTPKKNVNKAQ